ncbi:Uma2 family endonuclease [Kovacikia minuta CCNUW1]|uniref:Uma2 family endonuclease n=1 Tax=Kovacikia minuta TaxID=2931930 RepID=UPI001CCF37EA|nr:Uma2 family endonuclease [Kovacikia minuta]UBF27293.1 Uma2 family endonuclease [Kovacikia minuta CCNUW1]
MTYVLQPDPPLPPWQTLPTMYDLPCEDPEEPGLPDEFHDWQPQLLSRTLRLNQYPSDQFFTGSDLNLYYDLSHLQWYKRPDWFLAVGVSRLYRGDLRRSYVIWQETHAPFVVVEFLSPGTETEDLGPFADSEPVTEESSEFTQEPELSIEASANGQSGEAKPPSKWEVYERILRVPYYIVFDRHSNQLRCFQLVGGHYQEQPIQPENPRLWIPELAIGLGLWQGEFAGIDRLWLRWYDAQNYWIATDTEQALEQAERERQRANQAEARLLQVAQNLLQSGMAIAQVSHLTGLSESQIQQIPGV